MLGRATRRFAPTLSRSAGTLAPNVSGLQAGVTAVLGSQYGDEGKGKVAAVLAEHYDVVARFNGGANAGHTVVHGGHKFAFHLLPCGIVYPHTMNVLGNGTVINLDDLFEELAPLEGAGVSYAGRLLLSDRAHLLFGFHKAADAANEARRSDPKVDKGSVAPTRGTAIGAAIGTTKKGIGPAYTGKAARTGVRVGALRDWDGFVKQARFHMDECVRMHGLDGSYGPGRAKVESDFEDELARIHSRHSELVGMIEDTVWYLHNARQEGKRIITEGANALMLDLDFGTYPFVTSSSTSVGGVSTGLGIPPAAVECSIGVVKAYMTRVGGGPFPTELTDERGGGDRELNGPETEIGLHLQTVGAEIGVTTGRKRRCGWFDAPVVQYAHVVNGFSSLNITKLDVLDDLDEVKIATHYTIDGKRLPYGRMPSTLSELAKVEVEYETLPGWKQSIVGCPSYDALPENAKRYVTRLEELIGVPVSWIGTGPGSHEMVRKGF